MPLAAGQRGTHRKLACALAVGSLFAIAVGLPAQDWRQVDGLRQSFSSAAFDVVRSRIVTVGDRGETREWDGTRWLHRPIELLPNIPLQMAYDSVRNVTVALVASGLQFATWEFDGARWQQRATPASPPARTQPAIAFDALRGRVVLFGGTFFGPPFGDTWEWDGVSWQQRVTTTAPAPRYGAAMAFDSARGRCVLVGGWPAFPLVTAFQDTWEWDGANWVQRAPSAAPGPHAAHAMAYDAGRQRVVLFGNAGAGAGDTWEYDGSTWVQAGGVQPPNRSSCALVFDSTRQRTVMFGGASFGGPRSPWEWDGTVWTPSFVADEPEPRSAPSVAHSLPRDRTVLFGGSVVSAPSADTWEWDGRTWSLRQPAVSPPPRLRHVMWDEGNDVLVFGGFDATFTLTNDTWRFDGTTWSPVVSATAPSARRFMVAGVDPAGGGSVLFGGQTIGGVSLGDTWVLRNNTWTQIALSPSPGPRGGAVLATDLARQRVVLFGGVGPSSTFLNDTWEWNGTAWLALQPPVSPPATATMSMAYEPTLGVTVLTVRTSNTDPRMQVWLWNGATWQLYAPPTTWPQPVESWAVGTARGVLLYDGSHLLELATVSPSVVEYGVGCGVPAPKLSADGWPRTAVPEFGLSTSGHAANALLAFVLADQPANVPIVGCTLLVQQTGVIVLSLASAAGFAALPVPVPSASALVGVDFHCQALSLAAAGLAASPGLRFTIGR